MKTASRVLLGFLLSATFGNAAWAETELIGTTQIAFGQPLDAFYPNIVHPDPVVKVMSFTGTASNFGGSTVRLGIHFDYLDDQGVTHVIPAPNFYQNALAPGAIDVVINGGPVQLPFCPEQVSIHFELLDPGEAEFQGIFDHTCIPVPEPGALVLGGLGTMAFVLAAARRRRRKTRVPSA